MNISFLLHDENFDANTKLVSDDSTTKK